MGKPYGAAADAWSIGVLAYEILTLSEPFRSPNLAALMKRVIACEYDAQSLADAPHDDEVKAVATDKVTHVARRPMHTPRSMAAALTSRGPPPYQRCPIHDARQAHECGWVAKCGAGTAPHRSLAAATFG